MGGWNSGKREKRQTVEQMHRFPALGIGETVRVSMPRGGARLLGKCPQCHSAVRDLYAATPDSAPACRACQRLSYSSSQRQHCQTRALSRTLREKPEQLRPMLEAGKRDLIQWIDAPKKDNRRFSNAMRIFDSTLCVWGEVPDDAPDDLARPQLDLTAIRVEQTRIIGEDVVSSEHLINRILRAIAATPNGSKEIPRLIQAFISVSNLREVRAQALADLVARMESETQRPAYASKLHDELMSQDPEYEKLVAMAQSGAVNRGHVEADDYED